MITMSAVQYASFGVKTINPWYRLEPVSSGVDYVLPNKVMDDLDRFYVNGDEDAGAAFDELEPIEAVVTEDADFYWKWSSFHVDFNRGNKMLALMNDYIRLSTDSGATYPNIIYFEGTENIGMSYIFSNGNIIWATKDKIYLSDDNLTSYSEIIVKDTDNSIWTPTGDGDNFKMISMDNYVDIDGTEYLVWGNYGNVNGTNQANVYYTVDGGANIKIAYKFGVTSPIRSARHVHAVNLNPNDNSFWVQTGDSDVQCHWMRGTHNLETDVWTWNIIAYSGEDGYNKTASMYFTATDIYWGSDCTGDVDKRAIFKCAIADILDEAEYVLVYDNADVLISNLKMNGDGELVAGVTGDTDFKLVISPNSGVTTTLKTITVPVAEAQYYRIGSKNADGWWRMDCAATAADSYANGTLWVKLK